MAARGSELLGPSLLDLADQKRPYPSCSPLSSCSDSSLVMGEVHSLLHLVRWAVLLSGRCWCRGWRYRSPSVRPPLASDWHSPAGRSTVPPAAPTTDALEDRDCQMAPHTSRKGRCLRTRAPGGMDGPAPDALPRARRVAPVEEGKHTNFSPPFERGNSRNFFRGVFRLSLGTLESAPDFGRRSRKTMFPRFAVLRFPYGFLRF